jgi:tRNA threonylcarbamoyladenosine biosynthesis protein TsaB
MGDNNKPLILNIETSTNVCSVSLSGENGSILSYRENLDDKSHSALLAVFVEEILRETGKKSEDLDAVSVSKGPGSYTGLRIGVSTAKGICYARSLPLIALNTLDIITSGVLRQNPAAFSRKGEKVLLCPMIDARRMEVYTAIYDVLGNRLKETSADIIDDNSFKDLLMDHMIVFFGNGAAKCREAIAHPNAQFLDGVYPSAREMGSISIQAFMNSEFENLAYFEPFYLKDFIATVPKNQV